MAGEDLLRAKREENLRVCAKYGAYNVRVRTDRYWPVIGDGVGTFS
jgi:hypothetical protein